MLFLSSFAVLTCISIETSHEHVKKGWFSPLVVTEIRTWIRQQGRHACYSPSIQVSRDSTYILVEVHVLIHITQHCSIMIMKNEDK